MAVEEEKKKKKMKQITALTHALKRRNLHKYTFATHTRTKYTHT